MPLTLLKHLDDGFELIHTTEHLISTMEVALMKEVLIRGLKRIMKTSPLLKAILFLSSAKIEFPGVSLRYFLMYHKSTWTVSPPI